MEKEEFIRFGYVPIGYFAPPLSSTDPYPAYIQENAHAALHRLHQKQTPNCTNFLFMADLHYSESVNHNLRTQRLLNACAEFMPFCQQVILGGDLVNDGTKEYKTHQYQCLHSYFKDLPCLPVMGNHDDNSIWDQCIEAEVSTHHLTTQELSEVFFGKWHNPETQLPSLQPSLYYFVDDSEHRLRYIIVDVCDIPTVYDEKGRLRYTKQHTYGFSQAQLDWLVDTAFVLPENGWDVMVFSHTFHDKPSEFQRFSPILDLMDAFFHRKKLDATYLDGVFQVHIHADFTKKPSCGLLAGFAGHHHKDMICHTPAGIPLIYTSCLHGYLREDGNASELLLDAVTVDQKNRKILLTRIGAGDDREVICPRLSYDKS